MTAPYYSGSSSRISSTMIVAPLAEIFTTLASTMLPITASAASGTSKREGKFDIHVAAANALHRYHHQERGGEPRANAGQRPVRGRDRRPGLSLDRRRLEVLVDDGLHGPLVDRLRVG